MESRNTMQPRTLKLAVMGGSRICARWNPRKTGKFFRFQPANPATFPVSRAGRKIPLNVPRKHILDTPA